MIDATYDSDIPPAVQIDPSYRLPLLFQPWCLLILRKTCGLDYADWLSSFKLKARRSISRASRLHPLRSSGVRTLFASFRFSGWPGPVDQAAVEQRRGIDGIGVHQRGKMFDR